MSAKRVVTVVVVTVVGMVVLAGVVAGDDSTHHNYATTRRRSSEKWALSQPQGARRSIFQRLWPDAAPRNPPPAFLSSSQSQRSNPIMPQLHENDFITDDDDYDVETNPLWQPQNSFSQRPPTSLESLQHLLEGEVMPGHSPSVDQISLGEMVGGDEIDADKTFGGQDTDHRNHYLNDNDLFPNYDIPSQPSVQVQLPQGDHKSFDNPEMTNTEDLEEETIRDVLSQLGLDGNLVNNGQFPGDFLGQPPRLVDDDGRETLPISSFLAPGQYPSSLSEQEPFLKNLFSGGQLPTSLGKEDIFSSVDNLPDYPDQATVSDFLTGQQSFQGFPQHNSLMSQNFQDGPFQGYPFEQQQQVQSQENVENRRPEWFSSFPFHLPSSKDLITGHTNPELTEDGQREACHARNLHACGGRVINEFTQQPNPPQPCRIREEFLDCMEEKRGLPCEVQGQNFTREETKRIRDQVKMWLWSASGCILGHSA